MRKILLPVAWLYGALILIRNYFYDKGWLRSFEFDFPVIMVGNLTTGGTGKTPHVEYIIRVLKEKYHVATLSRGYKRKMHGYGLATDMSLVEDIGDESKLYKQKFPDIEVAVDENRVEGVYYILQDEPEIDVILMDDGFQHRRIKPGLNIILTKYHDLFVDDHLLPAGNLREPKYGIRRAQIIIITRCPENITGDDKQRITKKIKLRSHQQIFFTGLQYGEMYPLFSNQKVLQFEGKQEFLLVTGIAPNKEIEKYLEPRSSSTIKKMKYRDHHNFSDADIMQMTKMRRQADIINTTEKDAMRLMEKEDIIIEQGLSFFVLPVEVFFLQGAENFRDQLYNFIDSIEVNKNI